MWTRQELKQNAKSLLKTSYWRLVLAAIILSIATYGFFTNVGSSANSSLEEQGETVGDLFAGMSPGQAAGVAAVVIGAIFITLIISAVIKFFIYNPLLVGAERVFVLTGHAPTSIKDCFYVFGHSYLNVVATMFLKDLFEFLWSLLFLIPGIVKSYQYRMIPLMLAEDPTISTSEAFKRTKVMMAGEKWKTFVLDLSFIGWYLLSVFTLGLLALFYVAPYEALTEAQLYHTLKGKTAA